MTANDNAKDRLFAEQKLPGDFVFDDKVASVFDDMIQRSVPGYSTIIAMIGVLAERYCQPDSRVYDLGCSLGGATYAIAHYVAHQHYSIIAVDNSTSMIQRLRARLQQDRPADIEIDCRCEDVLTTKIEQASVVVLNFTLQFIAPEKRSELIQRIQAGLKPGGILIISEKIVFPDASLNELFIDMYHGFKETMGYSKLEISRKRAALENVLVPETLDTHRQRLQQAGFDSVDVWFQCFNFASMVAIK